MGSRVIGRWRVKKSCQLTKEKQIFFYSDAASSRSPPLFGSAFSNNFKQAQEETEHQGPSFFDLRQLPGESSNGFAWFGFLNDRTFPRHRKVKQSSSADCRGMLEFSARILETSDSRCQSEPAKLPSMTAALSALTSGVPNANDLHPVLAAYSVGNWCWRVFLCCRVG